MDLLLLFLKELTYKYYYNLSFDFEYGKYEEIIFT